MEIIAKFASIWQRSCRLYIKWARISTLKENKVIRYSRGIISVMQRFLYLLCVICVISVWRPVFGIEIKLIESFSLSQQEILLLSPGSFGVTNDDVLIIADRRDACFKMYSLSGAYMGKWGCKSLRPNDIGTPNYCDFQEPFLSYLDYGRQRVFVYRRESLTKYEKTAEFICPDLGYDIHVMPDRILISGFVTDPKREDYELYSRDLKTGAIDYLIASREKYDFDSKLSKSWTVIGQFGYCAADGQFIYYVWQGDLRIVRKELETRALKSFGNKTNNYHQPIVTATWQSAYDSLNQADMLKEKRKYSFVSGVFADTEFVGIIYYNYNCKIGAWAPILQVYSPDGALLSELMLHEASSIDDYTLKHFYYRKDINRLYYLSSKRGDNNVGEYRISIFEINK